MDAQLPVRRLLIDLKKEIPRHWFGGDAFRTAFMNALSMSFPVGEQYFIDSVRAGVAALPDSERERFSAELQGFIGQEATHRHIHGQFNAHLESQGYVNTWQDRARARIARLAHLDARHHVAITAAYEHYTAILAEWLLAHPEQMVDVEPRLVTMWLWHASEETEHRTTAFDVYRALGGDYRWRVRWMRRVTLFFAVDLCRQTVRNLHHDGQLLRVSTARSAWQFLLGKKGLVRHLFRPWRAYFRRDFHPSEQGGDTLRQDWLAAHAADFRVISAAA